MEVASLLGRVGLPAPSAELAGREWDAVVVGGGHNGLTAAAYLARAGQSVLVLERRERLGGACPVERPFAEGPVVVGARPRAPRALDKPSEDDRSRVSPCASGVGLLAGLVIPEPALPARGYRVT